MPLDLVYGRFHQPPKLKCTMSYCEEQRVKVARIYEVVRKTLKKAVRAQELYHDGKGVRARTFKPGELVLREYPPLTQMKLGPKYTGPWVVMGMTDTHTVEICRGGSPIRVHVNCLKPYYVQEEEGSGDAELKEDE